METPGLQSRIRAVRARLLWIVAASAACWGLALAIAVTLAAAWLDLLWELPAAGRVGALGAAALAGLALTVLLVVAGLLAAKEIAVARRLDRAGRHGGAILAGCELAASSCAGAWPGGRRSPLAETTDELARMAVAHAARLAEKVPAADAAPVQPLWRSLAGLGLPVVFVVALVVCLPELARTEWNRFRRPTDDVPPFSLIRFEVTPGDAKLLYGSDLEISAMTNGGAVEQVELVLARASEPEEVLPMFRQPDGQWQTVLSRVTSPAGYYLRAHGARTRRYSIRVITVPRIDDVRVRITPPAYTRLPGYEGPLPREGVVGLAGTKVEIRAGSNRPLSGGRLVLSGGQAVQPGDADRAKEPASDGWPGAIRLTAKPVPGNVQQVVGRFLIAGAGKFQLYVTDAAGQDCLEPFSGTITCLADERPTIRLMQPEKVSFATPTTELPIELAAEDDYGVSRVELYRNLNDSRPLPTNVPLGTQATNSVNEMVTVPLAALGVEPGDVIKLFARAEDNDPAGAKGAESPVATVQIISQEEFERMIETEQGIEVLLAKYDEARRRIESLAEKVEKLNKELEAAPSGKQADELQKKMEKLVDELRKQSEALQKLSEHRLPVDIDESLSPKIGEMAKMTQQMADDLEKSLKQSPSDRQQIQRQLEKMAKQLGQEKQDYQEQVSQPLGQLAAVLPLLADQQRFAMLAQRQKDLAERLASLADSEDADDPAVRARMRDLEEEQRQNLADLEELAGDIEKHTAKLPEDPGLDELRQTAGEFVDKLRASRAEQAMVESETALADFSGSRAHEKAQEAADLLDQFVKKCEGGMGQCAGNALRFQPSLSSAMGNSVAQLLAMMGLGAQSGYGGAGMGSGGFSAQRGGYGVYGDMPGMTQPMGNAGRGRMDATSRDRGRRTVGGRHASKDDSLLDDPASSDASGIGQAAVPAGSRRRVGQYFQRVNEETREE